MPATADRPGTDAAGPLAAPTLGYGYDAVSNLTSATDPLGKTTAYAFDNLDRLKSTTLPDPDGAGPLTAPVTSFAYDAASNLTGLTDPLSNVTSYVYNNMDRLIQTIDPLSKSTHFAYDAASRLTKRTDRLGREIQYAYDNLSRVTAEKWYTGGTLQRTITAAYDAADQLTSLSDPDATLSFGYDAIGRLTSAGTSGPVGGQPNLTLSYQYDAVGNRTRMSDSRGGTGYGGTGVTDYTYDNLDRVTTISRTLGVNAGPQVAFGYDTASRMTSITRTIGGAGTAVASTLGFDALDRLTSLSHQVAGGATLATYAYAYDVASRLTSETNAEGTAAYSYDANAQLLGADRAGTSNDETYTYDKNGNRTLAGYTTGANNRLTASPGYTYTYDDEGNLATKVQLNGAGTADDLTTTYTYDHRNRMTAVTTRNASNVVVASASFKYDALDRRIRTTFDTNGAASGGVTTTWTAYDGQHAYADFASGGSLQTRYLHGPAVDMLLARTTAAGVTAWYLTDRQGSVRDIANTSGAVIDHIVYDAYGRVVSESNPTNGDKFKYTGRESDPVTGLQYNRARYYDAVIGAWTQEDPIGYSAQDSNLYRYVGNSPTNWSDPSGLQLQSGNVQVRPGMPSMDGPLLPPLSIPRPKWWEQPSHVDLSLPNIPPHREGSELVEESRPPDGVSRPLTPLEKQFLSYMYCSVGYSPDLVNKILDEVLLLDATYYGHPLGSLLLLNPGTDGTTQGNEQYYKKMPAPDSRKDLPLIGHETLHSLEYGQQGYLQLLAGWAGQLVYFTLKMSKDPYRAIETESRGYAIQELITENMDIYDIMKQGGCLDPDEAKRIRDRFFEILRRYYNTYR